MRITCINLANDMRLSFSPLFLRIINNSDHEDEALSIIPLKTDPPSLADNYRDLSPYPQL